MIKIFGILYVVILVAIILLILNRAFYCRFWWTCNSLKNFYNQKNLSYSSKLLKRHDFLKFIINNSIYKNYFMTHIVSGKTTDARNWKFASAIMSKDGLMFEIPKFRFLEFHDSCCYIALDSKFEVDLIIADEENIDKNVLQNFTEIRKFEINNKMFICASHVVIEENFYIDLEEYLNKIYVLANENIWLRNASGKVEILTHNDFMKYYRDGQGLSEDKKNNYLNNETDRILQIINDTLYLF